MPPIGGFYLACSLSSFSMIVYTPAPLGPSRRGDWRADPYLCGLTEVPTRYQRPQRPSWDSSVSLRRQFVAAPLSEQDCPF